MTWKNPLPAMKDNIRAVFRAAEAITTPAPKIHDPFLLWLDEVQDKFAVSETEEGVKRYFSSARKMGYNLMAFDEYYRRATIYFIHLIRSAPAPPIRDFERKWIKEHYGVEIK